MLDVESLSQVQHSLSQGLVVIPDHMLNGVTPIQLQAMQLAATFQQNDLLRKLIEKQANTEDLLANTKISIDNLNTNLSRLVITAGNSHTGIVNAVEGIGSVLGLLQEINNKT